MQNANSHKLLTRRFNQNYTRLKEKRENFDLNMKKRDKMVVLKDIYFLKFKKNLILFYYKNKSYTMHLG